MNPILNTFFFIKTKSKTCLRYLGKETVLKQEVRRESEGECDMEIQS